MVGRLRHLRLRRPARVRAGQLRIKVSGKTGFYRQSKTKKGGKSLNSASLVHTSGGGGEITLWAGRGAGAKGQSPSFVLHPRRRTNGERQAMVRG